MFGKGISIVEAFNSDAMVSVFLTATRIPGDLSESDDIEEHSENGWVDPSWNRWVVFDSRNNVAPIFQDRSSAYRAAYSPWGSEAYTVFVDDIMTTMAAYGCTSDNGDGTFYAEDAHTNYATGETMMYAAHVSAKYYDYRTGDWAESSVIMRAES